MEEDMFVRHLSGEKLGHSRHHMKRMIQGRLDLSSRNTIIKKRMHLVAPEVFVNYKNEILTVQHGRME